MNLVTEKDAKEKQCRFGYAAAQVQGLGGRGVTWLFPVCDGSNCMHWRWAQPGVPDAAPTHGYCGLAGQP